MEAIMLKDKCGIIFGVANKYSIAWQIAQSWHQAGARLAFAYQGERLRGNLEELASSLTSTCPLYPCDVTKDEEIQATMDQCQRDFGSIQLLLHSVAFAPKQALEGSFVNTTREAFRVAHDISVFSLVGLVNAALPMLRPGSSILTLTYYGAEKVIPRYNVMGVAKAALEAAVRYLAYDLGPSGIRVNAISAGPINTLAARGISGFGEMIKHNAERSPLRRNVLAREVGDTALYLASDLSSGVTGEVIYVDGGYHIMGM
jgi:enoyl-[acyl-carrier protein] reductase I